MCDLYIHLIKWFLLSFFSMRDFQLSITNFGISQINYHSMLQAHVITFYKHLSWCCCRCQWFLHSLTPDVYKVRKTVLQTSSDIALITSHFVIQWIFFSYSAAVNTSVIGRPELKAVADRQAFSPNAEKLIVYKVPHYVRSEVPTAVSMLNFGMWCRVVWQEDTHIDGGSFNP